MNDHHQLLQDIESQWPVQIRRGLAALSRSFPNEVFYVGAFWMLYCDYTVISAPTFGVNSKSEAAAKPDDRWAPAEWKWDVVQDIHDAMEPLYEKLSKAMEGAPDAEWEAVMAANEQLIGRVSRLVTDAARNKGGDVSGLPLSDDFLVFAGDVREDAETFNRQLRLSVDADVLSKLDLLAEEK